MEGTIDSLTQMCILLAFCWHLVNPGIILALQPRGSSLPWKTTVHISSYLLPWNLDMSLRKFVPFM